MTKARLNKAKKILTDFPRWCRVANVSQEIVIDCDHWKVSTVAVRDRSDYWDLLKWWQRVAPDEVNNIIEGVNAIPKPRHRAIIIMTYLLPKKLKVDKQMERLGIKPSTYYKAKNDSLRDFAESYKDGWLKGLSD